MRIFVVAALLIKAKQQYGKNQNKHTGLFINCIDFIVVRTKIKKKCLGLGYYIVLQRMVHTPYYYFYNVLQDGITHFYKNKCIFFKFSSIF
jgi:hypothetical protein